MKFVILVPTHFEAQLVPGNIKHQNNFVVSGMLKHTAQKIKKLIEQDQPKKIILLGFAGDLSRNDRIGQAVNVNSVTYRGETLKLKVLEELCLPSASCITSKVPVYEKDLRTELSKKAELVEMECWWAAKLCHENKIDLYSIRIISDNCNKSLADYFFFKKEPSPELLSAQQELARISKALVSTLS